MHIDTCHGAAISTPTPTLAATSAARRTLHWPASQSQSNAISPAPAAYSGLVIRAAPMQAPAPSIHAHSRPRACGVWGAASRAGNISPAQHASAPSSHIVCSESSLKLLTRTIQSFVSAIAHPASTPTSEPWNRRASQPVSRQTATNATPSGRCAAQSASPKHFTSAPCIQNASGGLLKYGNAPCIGDHQVCSRAICVEIAW